jgi:hypothetical protein
VSNCSDFFRIPTHAGGLAPQTKACKALARVARFIDLAQVEPDDIQVLLARLMELNKLGDNAQAVLSALAGMSQAMGHVPGLFDQHALVHVAEPTLVELVVLLFAEVQLSQHESVGTVSACLTALGGMTQLAPWQPLLQRAAQSITAENPDLVTTLCHHMETEDTVVVKGAHQLVVFIIETVGMSTMVAAQFVEDTTLLMMAEVVDPAGRHTQRAIYALRQVAIWMAATTVDALESVGSRQVGGIPKGLFNTLLRFPYPILPCVTIRNFSIDVCSRYTLSLSVSLSLCLPLTLSLFVFQVEACMEVILQLMMSTKLEVVEPARGLICALLAFPSPARSILKVLQR